MNPTFVVFETLFHNIDAPTLVLYKSYLIIYYIVPVGAHQLARLES